MEGQALNVISESAMMPQQQGVGTSKEMGSVDFDLLIAQFSANNQITPQSHDMEASSELAEIIQFISDLDLQQEDQPIDMEAIMSQLSMLLNGKVNNQNILHTMKETQPDINATIDVLNAIQKEQPEKIEILKKSIQNNILHLESLKSSEAQELKQELQKIIEKITTDDSLKLENTPEGLKQQSHLVALARNFKKGSNDTLIHKNMEQKTESMVITQKANQPEMNKEATLLNKQEFAIPIQSIEYKKAFTSTETKAGDFVEKEPLNMIWGESKEDINPNITQNQFVNEESALTLNKNNGDFVKIQNMDKIYTDFQKLVLQTNSKEKSMLTVNLQPEELGKMKIQLEMVEGMIKGTILVENEAAKHALQNHLQEMKNQIKNQDISLESLEVNVENQSFEQSQQPSDEENAFFKQRHTLKNAFTEQSIESNVFINSSTYTDNALNLLA